MSGGACYVIRKKVLRRLAIHGRNHVMCGIQKADNLR